MRTMKSWPTTAILVVAALGAVVALPQTPLSSAITYQGRLESAGVPYPLPTADLEFLLYDAATGGTLIDSDIRPGVLVVDGFFSTEILFNAANAYNGDARWLEIWVNGTQLLPRQELTPAPFAIYALNATGGGSCLWEESGSDIYYNDGRVGIGTNDPDAALHVAGVSRFGGEQMGAGGVPGDWMMIEAQPGQIDHVTLRFDQEWLSFWNPNASPNEILRLTDEGNLGIAFSNPDTRLAVYGDIALPFSGALRVTNQDFGSRTILRTGWDAALGDYLDLYTPGARTDDDEARVRITQSGYVGIGTLQPETMLDVVGTVQTTGLQLPTGAGAGYVLTSDATGWATWQPGGGFALPYSGTAADSGNAFSVTNTDTGPAIAGEHSTSGNWGHVGGSGAGVYGEGSPAGLHGVSTVEGGSGALGVAVGPMGAGIRGLAMQPTGTNYGVLGQTYSPDGYAGYFEGRGYFSDSVGIGTDVLTDKLTVAGTVRSTTGGFMLPDGTVIDEAGDLGGGSSFWTETGGDIYYDGGNVGIGTDSPDTPLHVKSSQTWDDFIIESDSTAVTQIRLTNTSGGVGSGVEQRFFLQVNGTGSRQGNFEIWGNGPSGNLNALTCEPAGDVGIGTTTPDARLHVSGGNILLDNDRGLLIDDSSGSPSVVLAKDAGDTVWLGNRSGAGGIGLRVWSTLASSYINALRIDDVDGEVGIGTDDPLADLHVMGDSSFAGILVTPDQPGQGGFSSLKLGEDDDYSYGMALVYDGGENQLQILGQADGPTGAHVVIDRDSGKVGIGDLTPDAKLDVTDSTASGCAVRGYASSATGTNYGVLGISNSPDGYAGWFTGNTWFSGNATVDTPGSGRIEFRLDELTPGINIHSGYDGTLRLRRALEIWPDDTGTEAGYFDVRDPNGDIQISLDGSDGRVTTDILEIRGGSDLSEKFDISYASATPLPGMVVCIDPDSPGALVVSKSAYDRTVAGVISGAGGVQTGMLMGQRGSAADGEHPVALTGRVYVMADASSGPIEPGDLLTTSDTPGHAMKAADHTQAQGAILGKAMTSLDAGEGLVLVLVSLQ